MNVRSLAEAGCRAVVMVLLGLATPSHAAVVLPLHTARGIITGRELTAPQLGAVRLLITGLKMTVADRGGLMPAVIRPLFKPAELQSTPTRPLSVWPIPLSQLGLTLIRANPGLYLQWVRSPSLPVRLIPSSGS